jgi:hypothetical protein
MGRRGKSAKSLKLIDTAYQILEEIQPATVRAVCYRLFTLGLIGAMSKNETNKVSIQLTYAREQGLIPWAWVVDETREAEAIATWENPEDYIATVQHSYRRNRWADQPAWIEVWSEKGTVRGTLAPVLAEFAITFRVLHGYSSATALYEVARTTERASRPLTVLYFGDFDPSGLHMSAVDLPRRLNEYGANVDIERLALTTADTRNGLPSFSAATKKRDARYGWYVQQCVAEDAAVLRRTALMRRINQLQCWELDALNPNTLRERVAQAINARIDRLAWERGERVETAERESLQSILAAWPSISRQA